MAFFRERLHLLTLLFDGEEDLPRIREKTLIIARLGRFLPDGQQAAQVAVELVGTLLRLHGSGRLRYRLGSDAQGRAGLELTCESALPGGGETGFQPSSQAMTQLRQMMDEAELENRHGNVKIRAVKWGAQTPLPEVQKEEKDLTDKLFAEAGQACLENLREQHRELVRQLEERSRQNEELNRLNAELHQLNRDLESAAAERAIAEMALKVAHEIRNPATVIGGLVRNLRKEVPAASQAKIAAILAKTGELETIVADFERLAAQRRLFMHKEDLLAIMRESTELLRSDFDRKEVALHLEHQPGAFPFMANVGMLKIALTHLLRNGLEACGPGGRVTLGIERTSGGYRIVIEDTGVGIPTPKLAQILEPFVTTKPGRIGLGLPIVKQIIEEHQGTIRLESREGEGTRVVLDLQFIRLPA
ncbi:MAG: HAMP domain-containing sensor histidine kinase [Desulfobacteraceae bacterium]|nr:HAMP domain-containing sensor histidine kinase [Desulfobacteraceae bacterium]